MAINGPWIGSSAVAETGQRWMSQAGAAVRIGTPFWMSSMGGKSKYDFELQIAYVYSQNIPWRGYATSSTAGAFGGKYYDPAGYSLTNLYVQGQSNRSVRMDLSPAPNRSFTIRSQDGNSWQLDYRNGFYIASGAIADDMFAYFQSKVDQRVGFFIS